MTVDEFVDSKVLPEYKGIVVELRKLMRDDAPRVREVMSYGLPMYTLNGPIAWISPNKTGITFGFRDGKAFEDKYGLLRGAAKHAKHVRIKSTADVNKAALRYYVKQAVRLDQR